MDRQSAAAMAADVVGHAKMMSENASCTLKTLRRFRAERFSPLLAGHRGKIVKSMGDGWIVTFASAGEAESCAMSLPDKIVLGPELQLRVGIRLGDLVQENEDVFGDGVNVASRLEALTEPGGVSLSDAIYSTLDGTLRLAVDDAGA